MPYYQHEFDQVEDYLHHRPPYLLVDRIVAIRDRDIETEKSITGEEFFLRGHFPGAAVFPGAMMQELSTQSAGILIAARFNPMRDYNTHDPFFNPIALGVLVRVDGAKFKGFAKPGDTLKAHIKLIDHTESVFDFRATLSVNGRKVMQNAFRLANVPSTLLQEATP
jgi:3-hydroxyacyl-[acyl-carrier-protein] dehydratase